MDRTAPAAYRQGVGKRHLSPRAVTGELMLFFIAGITGNVGGATARNLLESGGHTLRARVSNWCKATGTTPPR